MTGNNYGQVFYPGVGAYESFTITDIAGCSPAIGVLKMYPQAGLPAEDGDLTIQYDDTVNGTQIIVFKNCHIDATSYERNSGGQIVSVRLFDERWAWAFGEITGRYNIRLPNNWVNPNHEKTPQQLATMCFQAMGVQNFDVSALPNNARPDVDWDHDNPAQCLDKLVNDLGCRVVPIRSTGQWKICVTGVGNTLPEYYPYNDAGDGIDPVEVPDYIKVVTAPWQYQVSLQLRAVGRDTDYSWQLLSALSYCPIKNGNPKATFSNSYGFGIERNLMTTCSATRVRLADGTAISPQELAIQTVFRCWRVYNLPVRGAASSDSIFINKYGHPVDLSQLILSNQLAQTYVDAYGEEHARPAFMWGSFWGAKVDGKQGFTNYPPGTRIDYQGQQYLQSEEERTSFSLSLDPIDTWKSIITTSKQIVYDNGAGLFSEPLNGNGNLFLCCAVQVRDLDTWQPHRFEYLQQIGAGTNTAFCMEVIKEEIQPYAIENYDKFGNYLSSKDNQDEVTQQCQYFANAVQQTFALVQTQTRTYLGAYPIDMDGAINQVTYRISPAGTDTVVSRGTEHDYDIPSYDERRQRIARTSADAMKAYFKWKADRQNKQKGDFNT
jgi:hypothetical protein